MRFPPFQYMHWAKDRVGTCRYDLACSGVPSAPLPPIEDPAANRTNPVGDGDPVVEALVAARYGAPADHVYFLPGSTLGNYVLLSLLVSPGERVLVETPAYENLPGLVRMLGAVPVNVPRRHEAGWALDPDEVEAAFAGGIRTAFFTNLHNPTGTRLRSETIEALRAAAGRHGARIIMDEVYTEFLDDAPVTAYRADDPSIVVTSSLTKVYGLGALRAGWVLVPPGLRERVARFVDYLTVLPPAATAAAAEEVLTNIERYRERSLAFASDCLRRTADWADSRGDVDYAPPAGGLIAFPRFEGITDTGPLCDWLRDERDTLVVPGRFFDDPSRIRMAPLGEEDDATEALRRLGEGLDRFRAC